MEIEDDTQGKMGIMGGSLLSWAMCMTFDSVTILQKWGKNPLKFKNVTQE